jgi:DNA-binding NarL/FixJ family response regulator
MKENIVFLFVDDSRVSRMKIRQLVERKFPTWVLHEAASGDEAQDVARRVMPDLVSMDINMPGINGFEAVALLKTICPKAKIALLSGNIQDSMHQKAADMGVGFVEKPITEACIDKVAAVLND